MNHGRTKMFAALSLLAFLLTAPPAMTWADEPPAGGAGEGPGPGWGPDGGGQNKNRGKGRRGGMGGGMQGGGGASGWMRLGRAAEGPESNLEIKEVDGGVAITVTSKDKKAAEHIRKIADVIRANHELGKDDREMRKERREKRGKDEDDGDQD